MIAHYFLSNGAFLNQKPTKHAGYEWQIKDSWNQMYFIFKI